MRLAILLGESLRRCFPQSTREERKQDMTVTGPKTRAGNFNLKGAFSVNKEMKTVFEPIFPVVARNALGVTGITSGICLDIGSGYGMLALAIAREAPE
jgi:hypothetical protein